MKTTTLSLITIAILGLTGCGGSSVETNNDDNNETKELVNTLISENTSTELEQKETLVTVVANVVKQNEERLKLNLLTKNQAKNKSTEYVSHKLSEFKLDDLDTSILYECQEDEKCAIEAYNSLSTPLQLSKEEAYDIAEELRDEEKSLINDRLVKNFTCEAGEVKTVQHYGVEDLFSTANGVEVAYPSNQVQNNPSILAYTGTGLSNYDFSTKNTLFAEEIKNLPSHITNSLLLIGLENHGNNDTITLGNIDNNSSTQESVSQSISTSNWTQNGHVFSSNFINIALNNGISLQEYANTNSGFDVYIQDDTFVDFITVATCSKPDPIEEIKEIVNKFECSEKETLVQILGGEIDAFQNGTDTTTPSTALSNAASSNTNFALALYDENSYDRHFADTLDITSQLPNGTTMNDVTQAQLNLGYKAIGSPLYGNDTYSIGDLGSNNRISGKLYDTNQPNYLVNQNWTQFTVSGSGNEYIAQADLSHLHNTQGSGTVFSTMVQNGSLDIYVQDDTAVDFSQLNLCVAKPCGEDIAIDLSQLLNWTNRPSDAIENNVFNGTQYQGVWDDTLNWFDFDNANSDEVLEIPFCACGDVDITVKNFKADNNATVHLDSTLIVSQQGNDQEAMRRDDMGGNHVDGTFNTSGNGTPVNHVLRLNVHNFGSEFGVAIEGILNFRGTLGACEENVLSSDVQENTTEKQNATTIEP